GLGSLRSVPEEPKRRERARSRLLARDVTALDADAVRRQAESDRRDARKRLGRPAIRHEAVLRVCRLPEPAEGALLDVVEEGLIAQLFGRAPVVPLRDGRGATARREQAGANKQQTCNRFHHASSLLVFLAAV